MFAKHSTPKLARIPVDPMLPVGLPQLHSHSSRITPMQAKGSPNRGGDRQHEARWGQGEQKTTNSLLPQPTISTTAAPEMMNVGERSTGSANRGLRGGRQHSRRQRAASDPNI